MKQAKLLILREYQISLKLRPGTRATTSHVSSRTKHKDSSMQLSEF